MQSTRPAQWLLERYLASPVAKVAATLFLLFGVYCLVFGRPTIDLWIPYRIDLDVYRLGAQVFRDGGDLYGVLPDTAAGINLPFTYPPIAAVLFVPLTFLPFDLANVTFTLVTLAALGAVIWLVVRDALARSGTDAAWIAVALGSVLMWITPVWETVQFGQVNVVLMALVVVDVIGGRGRWWRGSLVGLAMAIKLTPAVFLAYFLVRRDWRALFVGVGSALFHTGIGFLLTWDASVQYWSETLSDPARIGDLSYVSNQSLNGVINRLWLGESATTLVWFGLCAVLGLSSLVLMWLLLQRGHDIVAMLVMGMYSVLASPVSWSHHWVWVVPLLIMLVVLAVRSRGGLLACLATTTALGVVVFYSEGIWRVEPEPSPVEPWQGWDVVVGNSYVIWTVLFYATAWVLATRAPREVREGL